MFNRIFEGRRAWFVVFLLVSIWLVPGAAIGEVAVQDPTSSGSSHPETTLPTEGSPASTPLDERFTRPPEDVTLPQIPSDPVETLITATNTQSASLGYPVDHGPAIRDAGMSEEFAGRAALLVQAVLDCDGEDAEAKQVECAAATNEAAAGIIQTKEKSASSEDVQAWPALYIDGDRGDDRYIHDYSVLIDKGGDDTYDNNSGANLQDTTFGPEGSVALKNGTAIGCEHPNISGVTPPTIPAPFDCVAVKQAVLIDEGSGDDVHGVFKAPRKQDETPLPPALARLGDGACTNDNVIRRIVIQGSGFQGNGLLMDEGGDDRYRGKTNAQGTGHVGGIGVLRDLGGGNDDYLAIRNSQGFALVATEPGQGAVNSGLLQDDGGNDRYHVYVPRPINPNAWFNTPGSGGVIDDLNQCDSQPRQVQGAALLGGTGQLLDEDGKDVYEGHPKDTTLFEEPGLFLEHATQGFGCDTGVGILQDEGRDEDRYRKGPKNRKDGASISETFTDCAAVPGLGIFEDDGPKKKQR